jgi:nucleoporin NUP82
VLIAYQDGRVDVCLDVEKVEARWETKAVCDELSSLSPINF